EADRVLKILRQHEDQYHAIDTEVRGWTPEVTPYGHGEVVCFSIFVGPNVDFGSGAQLLVDNMDEDGNLRGLVEHFREYFEDPGIKKVFQNYAFDRAILLNHGCRV
ncbi:POLIA, partial [Symbiodinium necroappetens]